MSREIVLARGRIAAEAGMRDACVIRRLAGGSATDPVTGYPTKVYTTLYTGKCRVQQAVAVARPRQVGEDQVNIVRFDLQLPVAGTENMRVGDEVTITAAVNDADLVNQVFIVWELAHKSEATARRLGMIERTGS